MFKFLIAFLLVGFSSSLLRAEDKVIHLFVALCDNETQAIAKVGAKIGNGDDPENNLYWGCSDGAQKIFGRSKLWKKIEEHKPQAADPKSPILRRTIFQHKKTKTILIAEAYQGKLMKSCLQDYLDSSAGSHTPEIEVKAWKRKIKGGSASKLTCFIGHNGLMEHPVTAEKAEVQPELDTITLCCISHSYFKPYFEAAKTRPIVQTKSLMYPGAFILHDVIEGWLIGETRNQLRTRAAKAYAKNQKIKLAGGYSIFQKLDE